MTAARPRSCWTGWRRSGVAAEEHSWGGWGKAPRLVRDAFRFSTTAVSYIRPVVPRRIAVWASAVENAEPEDSMRGRRLFWLLFPSYVLITVAALLAVALYGKETLDEYSRRQTDRDLEAAARLFADAVTATKIREAPAELDALAKRLGPETSFRFTVVDPHGTVIADSQEAPEQMDNHAQRPEIAEALATRQIGRNTHRSTGLQQEYRYLALPVLEAGEPVAVVRASRPARTIGATMQLLQERIALAGLVAVGLLIALSWWIARWISRPLEAMSATAARFAEGDLSHRVRIEGTREIHTLAEAMNAMAAQLEERIELIVRQCDQQDAILHSMAEGVLALDTQGRILDVNPAGSGMLHLDWAAVRGRPVHEVVRKADLLAFVDEALSGPLPLSRDIVLHGDEDRHLAARGTALWDVKRQRIGVLVVLNDVTQLHRLEQVRREFVANASLELATPVASLKGGLETLLNGSLEDREHVVRQLRLALGEASRLEALIGDILSLARIESDTARHVVELKPAAVREVLQAAVQAHAAQAAQKQMQLQLLDGPELTTAINASLLEQALGNLIDNALKYSPAGGTVRVSAEREGEGVVLQVSDEGPGIEPKHLSRLFERFYRVDKARSDRLGGTGLGLAIVKHIAAAHGGSVSVASQPGRGSTFRIHVP